MGNSGSTVETRTTAKDVKLSGDPLIKLMRALRITNVDFLYQAELWQTRDGRLLMIRDMDPRHARKAADFLAKHAKNLKRSAYWRDYVLVPEPSGDMAQLALEEERGTHDGRDAHEWLQTMPLVRALRARSEQI